jgi:HK97 gp10 family phage protein
MELRVTITGTENMQNELSDMVRPGALVKGLSAAGLFIEGQAKIKAPIDTGFLRNSIGISRLTSEYVVVGTNAEYASYVEEGTRKMAARPYLRPAIMNNVPKLKELILDALMNAGRTRR